VRFDDNWPIAENICEESIMQWNNLSEAESLRGIEEIRACLKKANEKWMDLKHSDYSGQEILEL